MSFGKLGTFSVFGMRPSTVGVASPTVTRPSITSPADGATDIGETPTITSSAFASSDGLDTHAHSDWKVTSDAGGTTVIVQSLDDAANKVSWTIPSGNLTPSTQTYVWVRHAGATYGDSPWSLVSSFTTASAFEDAVTTAFFSAAAGTYGTAERTAVDNLVTRLKTGRVNGTNTWATLDVFAGMPLSTEADALLWLNSPSTTMSLVATPAYAAKYGWTGGPGGKAINTNFVPSVDGVNYTLNDCSMSAWARTVGTVNQGAYIGVIDGTSRTRLEHRNTGGLAIDGPNSAVSYLQGTTAATSTTGLLSLQRTSSSARQVLYNGVIENSDTQVSNSLSSIPVYLLAVNFDGSASLTNNGQVSLFAAGSSMTVDQWTDFKDAVDAFITEMEAL